MSFYNDNTLKKAVANLLICVIRASWHAAQVGTGEDETIKLVFEKIGELLTGDEARGAELEAIARREEKFATWNNRSN